MKLLTEVERKYGKPVREEEVQNWEPSHYGESSIDPEGTPVIRINASTGRTESNLVHELFHLKLRADGFPILEFKFLFGTNTQANQEYMRWIGFHLFDPIQHWIFYPEMRKIGVDQDAELKIEFEEAMRRNDFSGTNAATERQTRALYYLKAKLQIDDPKLLLRIEDWYKRKGWTEPLTLGQTITQFVLETKPKTPEEAVTVFLKCINFCCAEMRDLS